MAITMYSGFVPVCLQLLGGLKTVLQKAEEHATAQKWDTPMLQVQFQATTAYDIIRSTGVNVGKLNYLGQMPS